MLNQIKDFIHPTKNTDLTLAHELQTKNLPTLWLLGKTGAGKSSLVQCITGLTEVEVGNGFAPCTQTAMYYDFPLNKPLMRFLDTRGLSEADYDPSDDLESLGNSANALIVVCKADEPEQSALLKALQQIKQQKKITNLLVVHTGVLLCADADRQRQIQFNQQQFEKAWGSQLASVNVDFETVDQRVYNHEALVEKLAVMLPIVGIMLDNKAHATAEEQNFSQLKKEVLWYAGSAGTSDIFPMVGLVSVPAIQAKMLHSLANQYGIEWNEKTFYELVGALGSGFALRYAGSLGVRQLSKLIPAYGQTVGAAASAAISFATTFGLGRVACLYFYHKSKGEQVSPEQMQALYQQSLTTGKALFSHEKN